MPTNAPAVTADLLAAAALDSPVGPLLCVAGEVALRSLLFLDEASEAPARAERLGARFSEAPDHPIIDQTRRELDEYFRGERRIFTVPLDMRGTEFQRRVWDALRRIPYGETTSYADIARRIDAPRAVRAVGGANGANPIPVIVPCHRVIGACGALTGFGGGLERKRILLDLERAC